MRRTVIFVSVFLAARALYATEPPAPDYSQEHLRELFAQNEDAPKPQPNVRWTPGGVEFRAFGINWRLLYLPILMPFSGSVRGTDPWSKFPDPFALTHTEFASTPRTWRDTREISKERRRIEKSMKDRARIKVDQ